MNRRSLLLASRSPRRRELVALLGLPFDVTTADVSEEPLADESPARMVARLSQAKVRAGYASTLLSTGASTLLSTGASTLLSTGASTLPGTSAGPDSSARADANAIIVACDTIVALDGEILGKPRDDREATDMLRRLRGRAHTVYSAVTLLEPATGATSTEVAETRLVMRAYTDAEVAAYVASGDPLDKAGAYAIQHPGFHPVASSYGCYANVIGLPLCHLTRGLRSIGVEPHHDVSTACQAHTGRRCLVYEAILDSDRRMNGVSGE